MSWRLTVAAVIEHEGRYLLVEEADAATGARVYNQPAGHVEPGESLLDAVVREVREETGLPFRPTALLGLYQLRAADGRDYLRVCFAGTVPPEEAPHPEDPDILGCAWVEAGDLPGLPLRSPLVRRCAEDWEAGRRLPLEAASTFLTASGR